MNTHIKVSSNGQLYIFILKYLSLTIKIEIRVRYLDIDTDDAVTNYLYAKK